ncbi:3965_t:CDS:2 [Paraglomus brasilianum]|uniref:3965_t:CDS:1 n=1 Tax=Paraglomus brasilianum TaxID=144538 RepID=A0A9N8W7B0_9GLOM|nr:3965_t:CDS:2 [Paraglomus brasilianum]
MSDERIVLNVGGIKYETTLSTLLAYPDTFLGRMFQKRNDELAHPTNNNEYFIDRDGHVFRYVLQYYRTGKIIYPGGNQSSGISKEELLIEFDFFQIPIPRLENDDEEEETQLLRPPNYADHQYATALDQFVLDVTNFFRQRLSDGDVVAEITVRRDKYFPHDYLPRYGRLPYLFCEEFGGEICNHLMNELTGVKASLRQSPDKFLLKLWVTGVNFTIVKRLSCIKRAKKNEEEVNAA